MSEINYNKISCTQKGCTVSSDGKCLEGLEIEECPHCTIEKEINENVIDQDLQEVEKDVNDINKITYEYVNTGEALEISETNSITCSSLTRLIILAGPAETGKTTLLASLFQLFQSQISFAKYIFAASKTLIGFEKICHESRIASEGEIPNTARTIPNKKRFLHLKVCKEDSINKQIDLLFTDISGEYFDLLINSTDECKNFDLAKRADHLTIFIDAGHLSRINLRQNAKTKAVNLLRSLQEANMLKPNIYIEIVFSKWDLLMNEEDSADHIKFVKGVIKEIKNKFSSIYQNIKFLELASRPLKVENVPFGYGIDQVFPEWVEKSPFIEKNMIDFKKFKTTLSSNREFSKYTVNNSSNGN